MLSQWTEHLEHLCEQLRTHDRDPLVLKGGMGKKARSAAVATLTAPDPTGGLLLLATGSYLGEGFDCPQLDTLFLAFPIAFKGRLVQYVGRILRAKDGKHSVEVHDYLDAGVPRPGSHAHQATARLRRPGFRHPPSTATARLSRETDLFSRLESPTNQLPANGPGLWATVRQCPAFSSPPVVCIYGGAGPRSRSRPSGPSCNQ